MQFVVRLLGRHCTHVFVISALKFLAAVLLLCGSGSAAETPTSDWQSEWQRVIAAGKKEGKVVVSVPPGAELRKALKEGFERRFGIELELIAVGDRRSSGRSPRSTKPACNFSTFIQEAQAQSSMACPVSLSPLSHNLSCRRSRIRKTGGAATCTWTKATDMPIRFSPLCR